MIRKNNLKKIYRTEEVETTVLDNVSIEIKQGEFISIMGPSGCGKSTPMNILGLLDNPSNGEYSFTEKNFLSSANSKEPKCGKKISN